MLRCHTFYQMSCYSSPWKLLSSSKPLSSSNVNWIREFLQFWRKLIYLIYSSIKEYNLVVLLGLALGVWNCGCRLFHKVEILVYQQYWEFQNPQVPYVVVCTLYCFFLLETNFRDGNSKTISTPMLILFRGVFFWVRMQIELSICTNTTK